jgi:F-type H+-transporting ATPase subunit gamma
MPSRQQIKARIASVKNTTQITKAMEMVAASRMRKSQELVKRTELFSRLANELLTRLRQLVNVNEYILFRERPIKGRLLIVITSDRGLAGAYNSNVLRRYVQELKKDDHAKVKSYSVVIGRQAAHFSAKLRDVDVIGVYQNFPDEPSANELVPILSTVTNMFIEGKVDAIDVIYTKYHSAISQEVMLKRLLPAGFEEVTPSESVAQAEFEPSPEAVLETATVRLLEAQLLQALLDSVASEHSMRMLAMKSATDNGNELAGDLTLVYNNARQAAITQELAEITGGAEAMNG